MITLSLALVLSSNLQTHLEVDPLLVTQAAEIWQVIGNRRNPIWPGWDASQTPILIYLPGKQDLLINHPKPPDGFALYDGPVRFPGARMLVKNGPTLIQMDGQNTTISINGVETLVVADRLSNLRQQLESVVDQARGSKESMTSSIDGSIQPNPYSSMLMFAHEAFHVYQRHRVPTKGGNEVSLVKYPSLSVENNVGYAMEADALVEALRAKGPETLRRAAVKWLAIRQHRRAGLTAESVAYEDGTEFNEGLAKYVEYRALAALQGRKPGRDMWLIQGFRGYDRLDDVRIQLQNQMASMMDGRTLVNNDRFGASPVRMRLYFSGMGVAALLDRLGAKWHDEILRPGTTLTSIALATLRPAATEVESALSGALTSERFRQVREEKERLEKDGREHIRGVLDGFDQAPSKVVLDYSLLKDARASFAFTPFGILAIDPERTVFRLVPISGQIGATDFSEDTPRPVLQDRDRRHVVLMGTGAIDANLLDRLVGSERWRSGAQLDLDLKLPGVKVKGGKATLILKDRTLTIQLT